MNLGNDFSKVHEQLQKPDLQVGMEVSVLEEELFKKNGIDYDNKKLPLIQLVDLITKRDRNLQKVLLLKVYDYKVVQLAIYEIRVLFDLTEFDAKIVLLRHALGFKTMKIAEFMKCAHSSVSRRNFKTMKIEVGLLRESKYFMILYWGVLQILRKLYRHHFPSVKVSLDEVENTESGSEIKDGCERKDD